MTPETLLSLLNATPGWAAQAAAADLDDTATLQILSEAAKVAGTTLAPMAARADETGCRVEQGRVRTPEGYGDAFRQMGADGWIASDLGSDLGGMDMPLALHAAASLPMEGAALPFMMLLGSTRAAAHCLAATAPDLAAEWCPKLASGEWAATICISEPDAGSDVGRIRTKAMPAGDGWTVSGTKCWISFGDHDMAERIGHLCLARTGAPEDGTRGLSLFLVADTLDDGTRNGIFVERIEEKLGLHGSPTCVLRFETAEASLIGTPGRGLPALFNMIELMRLQVGVQGAGVAATCATLARDYADDRRQGGRPDAAPVAIASHPDVRRQLWQMEARALIATALVVETAVTLGDAHAGNTEAAALSAFLLPLAKTFGGELGQANADAAIQVLGGAGYTREWPAERHFRDVRITTVYEGTTGMQAQDVLFRRLLKDGPAIRAALLARLDGGSVFPTLLARLDTLVERLSGATPAAQALAADAALRAAWEVVAAGLAERLRAALGQEDALDLWLFGAAARMGVAEASVDWALAVSDR
ncbi:acyl-CoA dehydrogenase family protein [Sagittula stellata]|uniref:Acyl-CoA dehydrogenase n=1 Tax=Sagittula stellata (strain ATCC 700073 / DSM 11524 / E-37) TaxID=388399 RepID=A3K468_SAGS3|nr:acyl-CoA dehydrogenase family protein [Sagittula stellata]EBA08332.1 acyl-CoA dehydrogenase [Sagittula stellata E-37]